MDGVLSRTAGTVSVEEAQWLLSGGAALVVAIVTTRWLLRVQRVIITSRDDEYERATTRMANLERRIEEFEAREAELNNVIFSLRGELYMLPLLRKENAMLKRRIEELEAEIARLRKELG